jgi:hypothetical protein
MIISQDRHEIYLTVAKYDDEYIKYLSDKSYRNVFPSSFMTMHQFGPWDILDARNMEHLGPILLAISLYADAESKKAKSG